MIVKRGEGDFHKVYRPFRISEVYGQDSIVQAIKNGLDNGDLPNRLLISGPIGAGKTTFSRIIGMGLLCENEPNSNPCCKCEVCESIIKSRSERAYLEYIPAQLSRKKDRDDLNIRIFRSPVNRKRQIFVFNECHKLHGDLITPLSLEFSPYYCMIFCSTKPESINERIIEGCKIFDLEKYPPAEVSRLLQDICKSEKIRPKKKIIDSIVSENGDNIRSAIIHLQTATSDGSLEKEEKKQIIKEKEPNNAVDVLSEAAAGSKKNDMPTDQPQAPEKAEEGPKATKDIEVLTGKTNPHILLIAPHGVAGDDDNTGDLVRAIHKFIDCSAIINEVYRKPKKISEDPVDYEKHSLKQQILNFNRKSQAELHPTYIEEMKGIITEPSKTTVFWIHGIDDVNLTKECMQMNKQKAIDGLIGHGQPDSLTCHNDTIHALANALKSSGINVVPTRNEAGNYRGHDPDNMNQWFKESGNGYDTVQSIQLEFGFFGFRDAESVENTARVFADSLLGLNGNLGRFSIVEIPDKNLVDDAFNFLKGIFVKHFHDAMLEAGQYIINKFYGGDPKRAMEKDAVKGNSLNSLIKEIKKGTGDTPSKSWFYNAVDLAAHEMIFQKQGFQTFGKLGHSQKLLLLPVPDWDKKQELAEKVDKATPPLTVRQLRKKIKEAYPTEQNQSINSLLEQHVKQLNRLLTEASQKIQPDGPLARAYESVLKQLEGFVGSPEKSNGKKKSGFRDWTEPGNNVNICTGCENDCIYCYAKSMARRFGRLNGNQWNEMTIRKQDVDKNRKLLNGLVGFPSSHDITPSNLDASLNVLGKLLRSGNEVLIVSKPCLDCIKRICDAGRFFKDKILFRFTIGAMDDEILSFWEPNAPKYRERKVCLAYARNRGFRTSVSMEPMLDAPNIEAMIKDLEPLVNEDIWLGTMNHIAPIKKGADERLIQEIGIIENGQRPEMLAAIYNSYKDIPKIKWKTDAWKIIESYLALQEDTAIPEPAMKETETAEHVN